MPCITSNTEWLLWSDARKAFVSESGGWSDGTTDDKAAVFVEPLGKPHFGLRFVTPLQGAMLIASLAERN